jgi:hypothetical protein
MVIKCIFLRRDFWVKFFFSKDVWKFNRLFQKLSGGIHYLIFDYLRDRATLFFTIFVIEFNFIRILNKINN